MCRREFKLCKISRPDIVWAGIGAPFKASPHNLLPLAAISVIRDGRRRRNDLCWCSVSVRSSVSSDQKQRASTVHFCPPCVTAKAHIPQTAEHSCFLQSIWFEQCFYHDSTCHNSTQHWVYILPSSKNIHRSVFENSYFDLQIAAKWADSLGLKRDRTRIISVPYSGCRFSRCIS